MNGRVPVSRAVFEGLEAVRRSGATNMFDVPKVAKIAEAMGFHESASWVREDPELYWRAVIHGLAVIDEPSTPNGD